MGAGEGGVDGMGGVGGGWNGAEEQGGGGALCRPPGYILVWKDNTFLQGKVRSRQVVSTQESRRAVC